jgi:predicted nucleotidyltransferase component of viral defense system
MKKILFAIFSGPYKDIIAFKGGTLAYLYYWLPRFSTDIDLDLLDIAQEQEVKEYIETLLMGFWNVENRVWRDLHRWKFHYDPNSWLIKIELNKRQNPFTQYEWIVIDNIEIQAQNFTSMVTNKLIALGDRRYNRDLYDINYFVTQWCQFDENIIKNRTDSTLDQRIIMLIQKIPKQFQENTILHQLWEVLDAKQKPWVKANLITETTKLLQIYLANNK